MGPALSKTNLEKTIAAPVVALLAYDSPVLRTPGPACITCRARGNGTTTPGAHLCDRARNASLQGAYLILAAGALGLDAGPMSGFDNAKVDAEFFPDGQWKSNFLCILGKADPTAVPPRNPRFAFDEVCKIL